MQGPSRTILTYFWVVNIGGKTVEQTLEIGEVSCVPRVGDKVYIDNITHVVDEVTWSPELDKPITWAGAILSLAKKPKKSRKRK